MYVPVHERDLCRELESGDDNARECRVAIAIRGERERERNSCEAFFSLTVQNCGLKKSDVLQRQPFT